MEKRLSLSLMKTERIMILVECGNCGNDVELPNGLFLSEYRDNPGWKGVSCPWCYELGDEHTIPPEKIKKAFGA